MLKKEFILILLVFPLFINAQQRCGTDALTKHMMEASSEYKFARGKINTQTEKWIKNHYNNSEKTIITIPIVVHVVWAPHIDQNGLVTTSENIPNSQIQYQIDVLNNDFRRQNIDQINTEAAWQSDAADCEIEFCLATIDPIGQPTDGINRIETTHGEFGMGNDIHTSSAGGSDDWPNKDYLNIWVCNLGSGLLGYATPPSSLILDGDGVVINYTNFGDSGNNPYHKGRTATHEIGHWLNLEHLWGAWGFCGDDQVTDTPEQETYSLNCPGFPSNPNSCSSNNSNGDMFQNYMDYTNDACMNLFTNGQKARMLAAINLFRSNMLEHNLCSGATGLIELDVTKKELIKIIDILGREANKHNSNTPLFYIYNDGSVEKKVIIK